MKKESAKYFWDSLFDYFSFALIFIAFLWIYFLLVGSLRRVFPSLSDRIVVLPAGKSATVEYLKNHFDEDINLSRIYRYLDKLGDKQHQQVHRISVEHTKEIPGGCIGVMFYDVTTLYFETDREDELRKTGFSEGNKYEGHTMLPVRYMQFIITFGM